MIEGFWCVLEQVRNIGSLYIVPFTSHSFQLLEFRTESIVAQFTLTAVNLAILYIIIPQVATEFYIDILPFTIFGCVHSPSSFVCDRIGEGNQRGGVGTQFIKHTLSVLECTHIRLKIMFRASRTSRQ